MIAKIAVLIDFIKKLYFFRKAKILVTLAFVKYLLLSVYLFNKYILQKAENITEYLAFTYHEYTISIISKFKKM